MKNGIKIGASKGAVKAAKSAVMDILNCGQEQKTICKALDVFVKMTSVNNTMISNCNITGTECGVKVDDSSATNI